MPTNHALAESDLAQFTGTDNWYRHALSNVNGQILYTDGAKYVAETGGAYWLLDEIVLSNCFNARLRLEEFQVWKLKRNKTGSGAMLVCEDGNDKVVYSKRIPFTDFPLSEITFYFENNTICLPSER